MPGQITSSGNRISVIGDFTTYEMLRLTAAMHNTIQEKGYQDIVLDFSQCSKAFAGSMMAIVACAQRYLVDGVDVDLELPQQTGLHNLFLNANWAYLINIHRFPETRYKGFQQVPAMRYRDAQEQHKVVSQILNVLLGALSNFDRTHLQAIEWSLNEITDNVLAHSESPIGGFVQVTNFARANQRVEFAVCDAGVGIPSTLRNAHPELQSDAESLDKAIREGITRDKRIGQGNGLYGTWRIVEMSGGRFQIFSGYANLTSTPRDGLHVRRESIPFNGTLIVASINYGKPLRLDEALKFKGARHIPVDFIEMKYEADDAGNIHFKLEDESSGFGSRAAGEPVRKKLLNLARVGCEGKIIVDFSGVPLVSSSFADEVFGKLFQELGPIEFSRRFDFRDVDALVRGLIDKAITQRLMAGPM